MASTIYDLTPKEFTFYLDEKGYSKERREFLIDEYSKQNTIGGQMREAFKTDEGRERANLLPMTKPEGLSGWEAIRSGEADLALPGFLVDGVSDTLETGERITKGIPVSEEDVTQAAFTVAGSAGGGSLATAAPKGSLRIFGGFDEASDPGVDSRSRELPTSVGKDNKRRFEIDDSEAKVNIDRIPKTTKERLDFVKLQDVLDHEEFYYQYPAARDIRVIYDTSIDDKFGGYFNPDLNLIAVNPKSVGKEKVLKTILHEAQHWVQEKENFGKGVNPDSGVVSNVAAKNKNYTQELEEFKKHNSERVVPELQKLVDSLPEEDTLTLNLKNSIEKAEDPSYFFNENVTEDLYDLADRYPKVFEEVLDLDSKEFINSLDQTTAPRSNIFVDLGFFKERPLEVDYTKRPTKQQRYNLYFTKDGEVEARNVSKRQELSLEERLRQAPESTESVRREDQWSEFNKGGVVDTQMKEVFKQGGMSAPEVEADPVSGNEVPPGSLPEEVRDDVDAKLSTGEYVVPADVLRYYGMKFFEDLRKQAKESLAEMDSEGRIGGEPMTDQEGTPEGLSEQEMALLQEIMSEGGGEPQFNQGGMVLQNPEFYPKVGMAEGGLTTRSSFNPDSWRTIGSSFSNPQSTSTGAGVGSYYKTYVGPNGETRLILFVNGEPTTPIPEGFTEQKSGASEVQEEQAKEEVAQRDDGDADQRRQEAREDPNDAQSWAEENYDAVSGDPIAFGLEQLQGGFGDRLGGQAGRIGGALMGPVGAIGGGLVGAAMQLDNVANARAAQLQAKAAGIDTTELDQQIEEYTKNLSGVAKMLDDAGFATGQKKFESLTNVNRTVPQTEAVFSTTRATDNRTPDQAADRAREIAAQYGGDGDSNAEVRTEQARTTEGTVSTIGGTGEGNAGISVRSGSAAPTESSRPQGRPDRPEMNKGGLVKRRKKKTTKT